MAAPRVCPVCGGAPDDPQQEPPDPGEPVGDLCTHPVHDEGKPEPPPRISAAEQDHMEWIADEGERFGVLRMVAKDGRHLDGGEGVTVETARRVASAKGLRLDERTV
jgi:hypothetical protein